MEPDINAGIVGYGKAGKIFHAPVIRATEGLRLHSVMQRHDDTAVKDYPGIRLRRSYEDFLEDTDLDVVVIATPNPLHFAQARQALEAGKHVVVDKPLALTGAEAAELVAIARQNGRLLTVYHNRRWDGGYLTVQEILSQEWLGRLVSYEACWDRFRPHFKRGSWRETSQPGSGILYDLGSHLIDQAFYLFGPPRAVAADIRIERPGGKADDAFDLTLGYPGFQVVLRAGMLIRTPRPIFHLIGSRGTFVKFGLDPQEAALVAGRSPAEADWGVESEIHWGRLDTGLGGLHFHGRLETFPGNYVGFYENLVETLRGRGEPAVPPEHGVRVIRLIECALQSHREGRRIPYAAD